MTKRRKVGSTLLELAAEAVAQQVDSNVFFSRSNVKDCALGVEGGRFGYQET